MSRIPRGVGGWFAFLSVCLIWLMRSEPKPAPEPAQANPSEHDDHVPWQARDTALTTYYTATATVSTIVRQLAFIGVAVVWLFSGVDPKTGNGLDIPTDLLWPGVLLITALILDLMQYVVRTMIWGYWGWHLHRHHKVDKQLAPRWFNWPTLMLFYSKIVCIGWAYALLGLYVHGLMPD